MTPNRSLPGRWPVIVARVGLSLTLAGLATGVVTAAAPDSALADQCGSEMTMNEAGVCVPAGSSAAPYDQPAPDTESATSPVPGQESGGLSDDRNPPATSCENPPTCPEDKPLLPSCECPPR